ncbi:Prestin [Eumeta japonica]|uniref:Prestin n=1 Tax=Eumeta variegata TaxID=151549 RepID=A0A4C1YFZ9_EUMVA|nr:Prestin [Eumeta japonica]
MAYALLSEIPPIHGLYMAFFPPLVYVVFGTSPHVSIGTFAVACLMAGKVVSQHAAPLETAHLNNTNITTEVHETTPYTPIEVVSALCFTVGIIMILMWVLRMGALSTLLSETLVSGFTTAASFHVLISQLKDLFGVRVQVQNGNYKNVYTVIELIKNMPNLNWVALTLSVVMCTVVGLNNAFLKTWVSKRSRFPVPIELLVVVAGTAVSKILNLKANYEVSLVGHIPTGLPQPKTPPIDIFRLIFLDACTITMVTYTISMSMALIFASKDKYEIDANQELLALGASNMFGSFFGCAPICASLSRSYIGYQAGSKTHISTVVTALLILCVLLWIGPFFEDLPRCVLAAIIVVSLKNMFMQVTDLSRFWSLSKLDALVWLVTFFITVLVNIDIGLGAGLLASLGTLFCRSQKPYTCLLGRVKNTDLYLDIKRYRANQSTIRIESIPKFSNSRSASPVSNIISSWKTQSIIRFTMVMANLLTEKNCKQFLDLDASAVRQADSYFGKRFMNLKIHSSPSQAEELPGVKIFHYCGGLSFASKNLFRATLYRKIGYLKPERTPTLLDEEEIVERSESLVRDPTVSNRVQCVIMDATALSYVDASGVKSLVAVHQELANSCIRVLLAGANGPVLETIEKYNSLQNQNEQFNMETFPTVHDAVVFFELHCRSRFNKTLGPETIDSLSHDASTITITNNNT